MKNTKKKNKLHKLIAKVSMRSAVAGAGLTSKLGYFQPAVPKRIAK